MSRIFTRQELHDLVWSEPIVKLAKRLGLSDVGLAKACRRADVPRPGRGYWARLAAGRRVVKAVLPPRGLGKSDEVEIGPTEYRWHRESDEEAARAEIPPPPEFPETVEALTERVRRLVKKVPAPSLNRPHPLVAAVLEADEARRREALENQWTWRKPLFDAAPARRRLRLLNAVFLAVHRCGCRPTLHGTEELEAGVTVGDRHVGLKLEKAPGRARPKSGPGGRPPAEPLGLTIACWPTPPGVPLVWRDQPDQPLEKQLTEIVVGILVAGEMQYRAGVFERHAMRVRRKEEAQERLRRAAEEAARRERERQRRLEQARIRHLLSLAGARRRAAEIRELVAAVAERATRLADADERAALAAWSDWAMAQADRLDPLSGDALRAVLVFREESAATDDD